MCPKVFKLSSKMSECKALVSGAVRREGGGGARGRAVVVPMRGTARSAWRLPRHPTHCHPTVLQLNGII